MLTVKVKTYVIVQPATRHREILDVELYSFCNFGVR